MNLSDHEGRRDVEARATADILEYIRGMGGVVTHTESSVDFGRMWIPRNYHLWAYWAGVIMASPTGKNIEDVIIPRNGDDFRGGFNSPSALKSFNAYKGHIKLLCDREPNLLYPIAHMSKTEIIRSMPRDLLELCWWCRTPRNSHPCHKCITCKVVDPALEDLASS